MRLKRSLKNGVFWHHSNPKVGKRTVQRGKIPVTSVEMRQFEHNYRSSCPNDDFFCWMAFKEMGGSYKINFKFIMSISPQ